jgi:hypothetical protein
MFEPINSVLFPVFGSFPCVLNFSKSNRPKKDLINKRLLFILDKTASMSEYLNEQKNSSKMCVAKKLIKKVIELNPDCSYDIMPFNETPLQLCKIDDIGEPEKCTYFSPLVPEIKTLLKNTEYDSVIFLSDGIPSEPVMNAYSAIKMIGNITRENKCNPVAVAIGTDADGEACASFAGSRGYNCFIKYEKDLDSVVSNVNHGINCVYEMLEATGLYVPVESDGNFYYIDTTPSDNTIKPTKKLVEKYLNLVIMKYMMDNKQFPLLKSLVEHTVLLLDDETEKKEILTAFEEILKDIKKTANEMRGTPCAKSAIASVFRNTSNQV